MESGPDTPLSEKPLENESPSELGLKGTFDMVAKTISGESGKTKDNVPLKFQNLQDAQMHKANAIKGMEPGAGQHRIKGNYIHHINGLRAIGISGDDILYVGQDQSETVKGDAEFVYLQDRRQSTVGNEAWLVQKTREMWVVGQSSDNYIDKHDVNAPESFEWKHEESTFIATQNENCYWGNSLYGMKTEIGLVDNDISLSGLSYDKLHVKAEELVSGIKEMLEDAALSEALASSAVAAESLLWAAAAAAATAGVAAGAENWIGEKAGEAWSAIKAHPVESTVIGVAAVGLAAAAFFVGPEDEGLMVPITAAVRSAGAWLSETFSGAGAGSAVPVPG